MSVTWWSALTRGGGSILIEDADRGAEYSCPDCGNPMIPKKGEIVSWHFAHKALTAGSSETTGESTGCFGEGPAHHRVKTVLAEMIRSMLPGCWIETEKYVGKWRPDISVFKEASDSDTTDWLESQEIWVDFDDPLFIVEVINTSATNPRKLEEFAGKIYEVKVSSNDPAWLSNPMNIIRAYTKELLEIKQLAESYLDHFEAVAAEQLDKLEKALRKKILTEYATYKPHIELGGFSKIDEGEWGAYFRYKEVPSGTLAVLVNSKGTGASLVRVGALHRKAYDGSSTQHIDETLKRIKLGGR